MSNFLRLNFKDVLKGAVLAVIVVALGMIQEMFDVHGFDFAAFDWAGIVDVAWKTGIAYLFKNLISDKNGRVLGAIG